MRNRITFLIIQQLKSFVVSLSVAQPSNVTLFPPKRNISSLATHPHMESWVKFPGLRNIYDVSQQNSAVAFPRTTEVDGEWFGKCRINE